MIYKNENKNMMMVTKIEFCFQYSKSMFNTFLSNNLMFLVLVKSFERLQQIPM